MSVGVSHAMSRLLLMRSGLEARHLSQRLCRLVAAKRGSQTCCVNRHMRERRHRQESKQENVFYGKDKKEQQQEEEEGVEDSWSASMYCMIDGQ